MIARRSSVALLRRCRDERDGVTAVEFALASPVLIMLLVGIWDIGHMAYLSAVMHGAVQQVARKGTIEGADTSADDDYVKKMVSGVAPGARVTTSRTSYYDFADISRPESWNDANGNGVCDNSETYVDENRNGQWDADIGKDGNGGSGDVVLYTVKVTYEPVFPLPFLDSIDNTRTLSAAAVKKNQPYALQERYGSSARTCT
ncbi:TadE/TadG family type IV pilus assembly protein [Novosphingobium sp. KN65.2]|uniref:TadE/TadG family type IV pilus assembly protein n=1 Tax=Novosphingobium sp. KN65.2 TaxID=1478134 RepID=UPI0005DCEFAF|nr:TadE/TadG family type IV pilus assembly protein [Novosphingobium sp. KN65.2]CDO37746.1 TadE-like protein [Novosphingobium sp. KN65.2]